MRLQALLCRSLKSRKNGGFTMLGERVHQDDSYFSKARIGISPSIIHRFAYAT